MATRDAKSEGNQGQNKVNKNELVLTVIVNGVPVEVTSNLNAPLHTIIPAALKESGNVGQSPDGWELKDVAGSLLDGNKKIGEFGFNAETRLFLSLKAGAAGE